VSALWERAESRWSGRSADPEPVTANPDAVVLPRHRRRLRNPAMAVLALLVAGMVALVVWVVGAAALSAGPAAPPYTVGCRGGQCAGGEPEAMACSVDAASFADLRVGNAYVEVRISDQCGAAWTRVSHSHVGDRVLVLDQHGRTETVTIADDASAAQYVHTRMLAAPRHSDVRACLESPDRERRCTPWAADQPVPVPAHP
jgi:hypothetical protein